MNTSTGISISSLTEAHNITTSRDVFLIFDYYIPYAMLINKYVTPIWYFVGLIGNILSTLFWSSQRIRTCNTAAVYLTCLALADFSYLVLHVFYELENPWMVQALNLNGWCQLWNWLYMTAQYFCVFLVCAFSFERFLSICHPFKSERFGRKRSPRIILILFLLSLALGSPQAYFWTLIGDHGCKVRDAKNRSFYAIWLWCSEMVIFGALPVFVLILNICVLRKIRSAGRLRLTDLESSRGGFAHCRRPDAKLGSAINRSYQSVREGTSSNGTQATASGGSHSFTATTVTLLWVSFYLIFTTLPLTIVFAIQTAIPLGQPMPLEEMGNDPAWQRYFTYFTARMIIREICMSHYVGNVFIYLATSRSFRRQMWKRMFSSSGASCLSVDSAVESSSVQTTHRLQLLNRATSE